MGPPTIPPFFRRVLLAGGVCAFVGALELWFYRFDLRHLAAAVSAGAAFGILFGLFARLINSSLPLATLSSALFGGIAGAVWWCVAQPPTKLLLALVTGFAIGGLYAWNELR
jgi:hypothetical protein